MKQRFEVVKQTGQDTNVFYVRDNNADKYNMQVCVGIYMASESNAIIVANIMNEEWITFLRNPT